MQPIELSNLWNFHAQVQGVANAVAELLSEAIGAQDEALLAMLQTELRIVREWILGNKNPKMIFDKLESVHQQVIDIEHRGVQNAVNILQGTAGELAQIAGQHTSQIFESALDNERNIRRQTLRSELTTRGV
jgi:iron uptake system EfeUOB component EfeO/EfeM